MLFGGPPGDYALTKGLYISDPFDSKIWAAVVPGSACGARPAGDLSLSDAPGSELHFGKYRGSDTRSGHRPQAAQAP